MIRRFRFDGASVPFEGRREVLWRQLPEGAEVRSARARVVPVAAPEASGPFLETIAFDGSGKAWGATRQAVPGAGEVAFHARRTLVSVQGTTLGDARLLVDLGGVFHRVGTDGELAGPRGSPFALAGNPAPLPGLTVSGFRVVRDDGQRPDVAAVRVRSVPANVSLAVGDLPPFWTRPGELAVPETTPDFAPVLQAYLAGAPVEHGVHPVPLVLHSDTIARLAVELELDLAVEREALAEGLGETTLAFDFGSVPRDGASLPPVLVPAGHRVSATRGRVVGSFQGSRVVLGPTGAVVAEGSVEVSPEAVQARLLDLDEPVASDAVDLLLAAASRRARLQLDVWEDLDGKPGGDSLLGAPVPFEIDRAAAGGSTWVSVPLGRELQLPASSSWLVVQALDGTAAWSAAAGGPAMQRSADGGFSWRRSEASGAAAPAGILRLRRNTRGFTTPVELQVGEERVSLERFEPLGRLDLSLDFPEVAGALNRAVEAAGPAACPEAEHLADGSFTRWLHLGEEPGDDVTISLEGADPDATSALLATAPDGGAAFVATGGGQDAARVHTVNLVCGEVASSIALPAAASPVAFALHPDGGRAYVVLENQPVLHVLDLGLAYQAAPAAVRSVGLPVTPTAIALSSDGEELFLGHEASEELELDHGVGAVGTERLEEAARRGAVLEPQDLRLERLGFERRPRALARGGGDRLVVLAGGEAGAEGSEVLRLAARRLRPDASTAAIAPAVALATARSGALTLVAESAGEGAGTLRLLDSESGRALGAPIALGLEPRSVAASPDGSRAYVAGRGGLAVVDLRRRRRVALRMAGADLGAVAVMPGGELVLATRLATGSSGAALVATSVGVPVPAEWALLSGRARPRCLGRPGRPALLLGGSEEEGIPGATVLAQPVPVTAGCPYELAFDGLAFHEDARARVVWRGDDFAVLASDTVALRVFDPGTEQVTGPAFDRASAGRFDASLVRHRGRFTPPDGATQAEVLFEVPSGSAAVADASFRATGEAVVNGDLRVPAADGSPAGWEPGAGGAPTVIASAGGVLLRNRGPREASLVQTVAAGPGQELALELGAVAAGGGEGYGSLRLSWLGADGEGVGETVRLEVPAAGFGRQAAAGAVPEDAVEARLELAVAPGGNIEVEDVSLRFHRPVAVPVAFVAQAPGELTVSGWEVSYEPVDPVAPAVPDAGLCPPAPAGDGKGKDRCFCPACGEERDLRAAAPAVTEGGRPARVGRCSGCGAPSVRLGGRSVPRAEELPTFAGPPATTADPDRFFGPRAAPPEDRPADLVRVIGIAERRAEMLAAAGIDSLDRLSFASPREVADALPRVSPALAADFIRQSRGLLRKRPPLRPRRER